MPTAPEAHTTSTLATWSCIESYDTDVPERILTALEAARRNTEQGYVGTIICGDMLFYHGEDGWVLGDDTLAVAEIWLESQRQNHRLHERTPFWFRIKVS